MNVNVPGALRGAAAALDAFRERLEKEGTEEADDLLYHHQPGLSAFLLMEIAKHLETNVPKEML